LPLFLWDASGLIKRYSLEIGSPTVNAIFSMASNIQMAATYVCYAETCAAIRRKLNSSVINSVAFNQYRLQLNNEILLAPAVTLVSVSDSHVLAGVILSDKHNINSADSSILAAYLGYVQSQPPGTSTAVLIAADQRLLRAAQAEGLTTFNSELMSPQDLPTFLASL
jgi:predicted nucleic acid-binding protein